MVSLYLSRRNEWFISKKKWKTFKRTEKKNAKLQQFSLTLHFHRIFSSTFFSLFHEKIFNFLGSKSCIIMLRFSLQFLFSLIFSGLCTYTKRIELSRLPKWMCKNPNLPVLELPSTSTEMFPQRPSRWQKPNRLP